MVTLQKSEKRKNHYNRVKITLKTSENHSKASENHSKKSEKHSKWVISLLGELTGGQFRNKKLSLSKLSQELFCAYGS